ERRSVGDAKAVGEARLEPEPGAPRGDLGAAAVDDDRGARGTRLAQRLGTLLERARSLQGAAAQLEDQGRARCARGSRAVASSGAWAGPPAPPLAHHGLPCTGRPQLSGQPSTMFRFWIACPAAPFPRLSIAAVARSVRPPCTVVTATSQRFDALTSRV